MFPDAAFQVIERGGEPIGRLYLDRRAEEIRIIDIALLPAHRRAGIGGAAIIVGAGLYVWHRERVRKGGVAGGG